MENYLKTEDDEEEVYITIYLSMYIVVHRFIHAQLYTCIAYIAWVKYYVSDFALDINICRVHEISCHVSYSIVSQSS